MDVTVRVILPLPDSAPIKELIDRYFDPSGLLAGSPLQALPSLLTAIVYGRGYFANAAPQYGQFFQSACAPRPQLGQG